MYGFRRNAGLVARARRRRNSKETTGFKEQLKLKSFNTSGRLNFYLQGLDQGSTGYFFDDFLRRLDFHLKFRIEASDWPDVSTSS